jgi:hypothetical protein
MANPLGLPPASGGPTLPGSDIDFERGLELWKMSAAFVLDINYTFSTVLTTGSAYNPATNFFSYPIGYRTRMLDFPRQSTETMRDKLLDVLHTVQVTPDTRIGDGSYNRFLRLTPGQQRSILLQAGYDDARAAVEPEIGMRRTRDSKTLQLSDLYLAEKQRTNWEEAWMTMWAAHAGLHPRLYACMQTYESTSGYKTVYIMHRHESFDKVINDNRGDANWGMQNAGLLATLVSDMSYAGILASDIKTNNMVYNANASGGMSDRKIMIIDLGADYTRWVTNVSFECVEMINTLLLLIGMWCKWGGEGGVTELVRPLVGRLKVLVARIMKKRVTRGSEAYNLCVELRSILAKDVNAVNRITSTSSFYRDTDTETLAEHIMAMAEHYGRFDPDGDRSKKCLTADDLRDEFEPYAQDRQMSALELLGTIMQNRYGAYL